jgi:predicted double-glycine peptidase
VTPPRGIAPVARLLLAALLLGSAPGARADESNGRVLGVRTMADFRWEGVVRQKLEVGCGAASLATIMTHYFGYPATEAEMADAMMAEATHDGQADLVRQIGFSMSHIRRVAEKGGLVARGFRVPIEHIDRIKIPVIARVSIRGYDHFLVFKAAQNGRVFVADPAFGNGSYRLASFEKIWSGVMIGFVRRGQVPGDHGLEVEASDDLGAIWEIATQRSIGALVDSGRAARSIALSASLAPPGLVEVLRGTESVFPRLMLTATEF